MKMDLMGIQCTHGSTVQARLSTANGNKRNGVLAYAGDVYCQEINCDGNGRRGLESTRGGYVAGYGAKVSRSKDDNVLAYGSVISLMKQSLNVQGVTVLKHTWWSNICR
ncbi:hypothetical protein CoNPh35_CDS0019 [Staphylococcus phage S-CoN_Ph35]|nr:hypothetical protein CoNPh35_CDS0019 [Staphylococcus phage S-CoN_Ph35]